MGQPNEVYHYVIVESFMPDETSGLHGPVHIRPAAGEIFGQELHVRCPKETRDTSIYPLGTKFRIRAKLTDKEGSRPFLHSHHAWPFDIVRSPTKG
jgi:hypothetical protein